MPRYQKFELVLVGIAITAIALAVVLAGWSWRESEVPRGVAVDRGLAALRAYDYPQARRFFTIAAREGDPQGEIWLADMMSNGLGAPPDGGGAVRWLTRAADAGSADAARRLGELYRDGRATLQDLPAARTWLERAANAGDPRAERDLGQLYAAGLGVGKDLVQAYLWLDLAASRGDAPAAELRDRVAQLLPPDDLRRGEHLAATTLASFSADRPPPAATARS